jgi:phosphatidylinositol kinase/protein kinase (PI-3  family)
VHIDFGFFLQSSPGNVGFESAPFKLTQEYVDIMGGPDSDMFHYFKSLLTGGLMIIRQRLDELIILIKIMTGTRSPEKGEVPQDSSSTRGALPCVKNLTLLEAEIRDRVKGVVVQGKNEMEELVERLVSYSFNSNRTQMYD